MACTPCPIPTNDVALAERLAEHVHDMWAEGRLAEGRSYGKRRDDQAKTHPGLVPYAELSKAEKDYDRLTAQGTLKAALALGYAVPPPDLPETRDP